MSKILPLILWRRGCLALFACGMILGLAGCLSLPDVQPFADSTAQIRHVTSAAGQAAVADLATIEDADKEPTTPPTTDLAKKFYNDWQEREKKMAALDDYASSLVHMVQSGQHGAESAKTLAKSVSDLASSVSTGFPGGDTAVQAVTALAADVYGMIAREVAAQKLEKAIAYEDPVIQLIAELLVRDLSDLKRLARQTRNRALGKLALQTADLPRLNSLQQSRTNLAQSLNFTKPEDQAKLKGISELIELETKSPWYMDYIQRRDEILRQFEAHNAVLDGAIPALKAWAAAHKQIGIALQQKQPPSFAELQQVSGDLLAAYQAFHNRPTK